MTQAVATIITRGGREFGVTFDDANENSHIDTPAEQASVLTAINGEITNHTNNTNVDGFRNSTERISLTIDNIDWDRSNIIISAGRFSGNPTAHYLRYLGPQASSPATPAANNAAVDIPANLNLTALNTLLHIPDNNRTPAQQFLILIAEAKAICSETTRDSVAAGGITRTISVDQLFVLLPDSLNPHIERFRESNTTIPYILEENHGLIPEQRTQLIRWLERSSIPSGEPFIHGGTRYRSALATEFSDMFESISQAHRQLNNMGTSHMSETDKIHLMTQLLAARLHNIDTNRLSTLRTDQITQARNYFIAYAGLVNVFRSLTGVNSSTTTHVFPTLEATPERQAGGGGQAHRSAGAALGWGSE